MHGRRRLPVGAEPLMDEENKKAAKAHALVQAALQSRKQGQTPPPIIAATDAVLAKNPEVYSLWNLKREVLQPVLSGPDAAAAAHKEMQLVEQCLQKNHKSYAAWHQRQWLVEKGHIDKLQDLKAVERHLNQAHGDPKNFHAWKYRSWLTQQLDLPPSVDLDFTETLLKADPSNFSAWHMRMAALSAIHCSNASTSSPDAPQIKEAGDPGAPGGSRSQQSSKDVPETQAINRQAQAQESSPATPIAKRSGTRIVPLDLAVIDKELIMLHELLAVDPANSSCWGFHRWLLQCACCSAAPPGTPDSTPERRSRAQALLRGERRMCREIVDQEAERIAALSAQGGVVPSGSVESVTMSLARMAHMRALQALADVAELQLQTAGGEDDIADATAVRLEALQQLKAVDSGRKGLYEDQISALQAEE